MALIQDIGNTSLRQRGTFALGSISAFLLYFADIEGNPYDPVSVDVTIFDPNGEIFKTIVPTKMDNIGEYVVDFSTSTTDPTGVYTLQYTFSAATETGSVTTTINEMFVVIATGEASILTSSQLSFMRSHLEALLGDVQNIPVKAEQAQISKDKKIAKFTFGRWNQASSIRLYRNNTLLDSEIDNFQVNWLRGEIKFDHALEPSDQIDCSYNFRWFKDEELEIFLTNAVNYINIHPVATMYRIGTVPGAWAFAAGWAAAIDAIRRILMDLLLQQPRMVFADPDGGGGASAIAGQLQDLKRNYEEQLKSALEQKKYGPYTGLHKAIITPELSLVGGRSRWYRMMFK